MSSSNPILIDIGAIDACCTDHALEAIYKALRDEDGRRSDIWAPHDNAWLRDLVEAFSSEGTEKIAALREAILAFCRKHAGKVVSKPFGLGRPRVLAPWTEAHAEAVRRYLESLPPGSLDATDWALAVEYLVHLYLSPDDLIPMSEWLVARSSVLGVAGAFSDHSPAAGAIAGLVAALPSTVAEVVHRFALSDASASILEYAAQHAAEHVVAISDAARSGFKHEILDHMRAYVLGEPVTWKQLEQRLIDRFDSLNRDWRRIAVTEATETANQGVISMMPEGALVRRIEMYYGACAWCKKLDGKVFRVVSPAKREKDGWAEIWPGKTNVGRSASPYKRVGNTLVPRSPDEMWWPASGAQHPHCRGRWEPVHVSTEDLPKSVTQVLDSIYKVTKK